MHLQSAPAHTYISGVGVSLRVGVGVSLRVDVGASLRVDVGVSLRVDVDVSLRVDVGVPLRVGVGVGVGGSCVVCCVVDHLQRTVLTGTLSAMVTKLH